MKNLIAISAALALAVSSACAATPIAQIDTIFGKILINKGKGYQAPSEGMTLNVGDKIFIGNNSGVTVLYVNANCRMNFTAPSVIVLKSDDDLNCVASLPQQAPQAPAMTMPVTTAAAAPAMDALPLVLGAGALVAGGVALLVLSKSTPVSAAP